MRAAITARRRANGRWRHQQQRRQQMESLRRGVAEPLVPLYTFGADDNLAAFSAKRKHTASGGSGIATLSRSVKCLHNLRHLPAKSRRACVKLMPRLRPCRVQITGIERSQGPRLFWILLV
eukprot:scaffold15270_cov101-Cyclotella_meneghiniana.AAC.3